MKKQLAQFRRRLIQLRESTRGNAMMLAALGMPVLIGATGYGVDTAQWYMWKRELQHSADAAALGGAWARSYSTTADYEARAIQEFNANQGVTSTFTATPNVQLTSYSGGTNNAVLVTATATRRLPFSGHLLNRSATISVSATAKFAAGGTYSACLVSVAEEGTSFTVGGSSTVIADCGLGALSCDANAIEIDGSATVQTNSITTCGTANVPDSLRSKVTENVGSLEDIYADWTPPAPTAATPARTLTCTGKGLNKTASPLPGIYTGGIKPTCGTTFASGIYFFDGGTVDLSHNASIIANNVLFVLMNGAKIEIGGSGADGSLTMSPMTVTQLKNLGFSEAEATKLSKIVIMQDKSTETPIDMNLNGNANVALSGVIYLPKGKVKVNGDASSASSLCFQLSAYSLSITGSAYLKTLCNASQTQSIGSASASVALVG